MCVELCLCVANVIICFESHSSNRYNYTLLVMYEAIFHAPLPLYAVYRRRR